MKSSHSPASHSTSFLSPSGFRDPLSPLLCFDITKLFRGEPWNGTILFFHLLSLPSTALLNLWVTTPTQSQIRYLHYISQSNCSYKVATEQFCC